MQFDTTEQDAVAVPGDDGDAPEWSPRIVYIQAAVTGLDSPHIPFVVLKQNPFPDLSFDPQTRQMSDDQAQTLDAVRQRWDVPFREQPRDQHYFLIAWSAVPTAPAQVAAISGLTFGIATPGQHYKRWIMTAAVERQGELVAWCEEIDMLGVQEEAVEVLFTEESMIRLMPGHAAQRASKVA